MEDLEKKHQELWDALTSDNLELVKELWKNTSILNYADELNKDSAFVDSGATHYLSAATNSGSEKVVDWLIDHHSFSQKGLDVGFSYSCSGRNGKLSIVKKLYEAGANPIAKNSNEDIWYYAKNNDYKNILNYLKSCGAEEKKKEYSQLLNTQRKYLSGLIGVELEKHNQQAIPIRISRNNKVNQKTSHIGDQFFLPKDMKVPTDKEGNDLGFLIQINFKHISSKSELPQQGILQFFIKNQDYHWDYDGCVLFHENITDLEWESKSSAIKLENQGLQFLENQTTYPNVRSKEVQEMEKLIDEEKVSELESNDRFDVIRKLSNKKNPQIKSYLCGHPNFIQDDPRGHTEKIKDWVLLLQLDGFDKKRQLWGRNSIAYWFIHPNDLKEKNFDSVYFCYQKG